MLVLLFLLLFSSLFLCFLGVGGIVVVPCVVCVRVTTFVCCFFLMFRNVSKC